MRLSRSQPVRHAYALSRSRHRRVFAGASGLLEILLAIWLTRAAPLATFLILAAISQTASVFTRTATPQPWCYRQSARDRQLLARDRG